MGVEVLGKHPRLPKLCDELWASCQVCAFSWGWYMQLSSDFQEVLQPNKVKGTGMVSSMFWREHLTVLGVSGLTGARR